MMLLSIFNQVRLQILLLQMYKMTQRRFMIIQFLYSKRQGYVSHKDIDSAIDRGQMSKFVELYSNPKLHQPGRPIPPIAYGQPKR